MKMIEPEVCKTIRNSKRLPRSIRRELVRSIKAQYNKLFGIEPESSLYVKLPNDAFAFSRTAEGILLWTYVSAVLRGVARFDPAVWDRIKANSEGAKPNRSSRKQTQAPAKPAPTKKEKEVKKKCSAGERSVMGLTMSVHELLEMLGATRPIIVVDHDGQLQGVINQPITKREVQRPPVPHKYVKDEIAICGSIQDCELIPGVIRQKLIAAIIDLANNPINRVKFNLELGERSINGAFQWTFNPFGAYGPETWAAVSSSLNGGPWRGHYDAWILRYRKPA